MRLVCFQGKDGPAAGIVENGSIVNLADAGSGGQAPIDELIALGKSGIQDLAAKAKATSGSPISYDRAKLLPPVAPTSAIICLGLNYARHAAEGGYDVPDYPALFPRYHSSLIGDKEPIVRPKVSEKLDYEVELAVVVGRRCKGVGEAEALDQVFGYTVFNDASIRDYQRKGAQWLPGKNFDATGPVGPAIVTADEVPPGAAGLRVQTRLNGEVVQDSNTDDMIFSTARTIALLSEFMTLRPGDLIVMGTPEGVGHARRPPLWMKDGDVCEVEVEQVGVLTNPIRDE